VLGRRQRFEFARRDVARHCFLALLEGEPAGTGWAAVREHGVSLNGGAVDPRFQGRGVYRALLAVRLALARRAGVEGVTVQARQNASAPSCPAWDSRWSAAGGHTPICRQRVGQIPVSLVRQVN
jgi:GNAT superfamily N-acetyltransferase